ncbi:hypothetical protein EDC04DRAFT_2894513 [Pisolithus marmoratus]|nr:hypothetical protein EDC04DRAFT_2894513 [Pisolithus marmoratus]
MALQQLCAGAITMEDIADDGGCDQSVPPSTPLDPSAKDTQQMDSKHDEQAVEDAVQDTLETNSHIPNTCDHPGATIPHTTACILDTVTHPSHEGVSMDGQDIDDQDATDADTEDKLDNGLEGSDSDWSADDRHHHRVEQHHKEILAGNYDLDNHPPTPPHHNSSSSSESDADNCTTEVHSQMEGRHV